jgi:GT2 family glycosyltransferase
LSVVDASNPHRATAPTGVWAVVVHHRHLATLPSTLASVIAAGVPSERVVCIDNSGADVEPAHLEAAIPAGVRLLRVPNLGYGDAANRALAHVRDSASDVGAVLVCTHEVVLERDCVVTLAGALRADPGLGAVGPVLHLSGGDGGLWSTGGTLTRLLRHPRHRTDLPVGEAARRTEWLDGAVVLYRAPEVFEHAFDTDYFLYLEENDLHHQLRAAGLGVAVVPLARATQDTCGMPDYYAARNIVLFQRRWGRPGMRLLSSAVFVGRRALGALRGGRLPSRDLARGFRDGLRMCRGSAA